VIWVEREVEPACVRREHWSRNGSGQGKSDKESLIACGRRFCMGMGNCTQVYATTLDWILLATIDPAQRSVLCWTDIWINDVPRLAQSSSDGSLHNPSLSML
jgi:hypothetical protein